MCENAEVGKGIERTCASYTRSVLQAQYNVDPVGVITERCVAPVGVTSCIDPVGITSL